MEQFAEYILRSEIRSGDTTCDKTVLLDLLDKYEWFTTARIMLTAHGVEDPRTELHCAIYGAPYTSLLPLDIVKETACEEPKDPTEDVIDRFLTLGEYKIIPREDMVEDYGSQVAEDDEVDDMVTEELAEIYMNQGLTEQAKEIYVRLSLLYPKKSVYFAEIIERIDRGQTNINN